MKIYFKELKKLSPTLISTVIKMNEEVGELSREVNKFFPYVGYTEKQLRSNKYAKDLLSKVIGELLDVGQTACTMFFLLHRKKEIDSTLVITKHLTKLKSKQYIVNSSHNYNDYYLEMDDDNCIISLPRLDIDTDLIRTFLQIAEEVGELSQLVGKKTGMSGEKNQLPAEEINNLIANELLDVAQCCVTMLYILARFGIDVDTILNNHIQKLHEHGYC